MAEDTTTPEAEAAPPAETPPEPVVRSKNLYYIGEKDAVTGEPIQYVMGVPARDLTEDDIRILSDAEYTTALDAGIYRKTKPTAKEGGS
jgi:hypothetical protein